MAVDAKAIGTPLPSVTVRIDRDRLRFFAKAIGETNKVYVDPSAARSAGHPDVPVPPTFLFGLELEHPDSWRWVQDLSIDVRRVLHGEQSFTYHSIAHADDVLVARPRIADIYSKKSGTLDFIVKETVVTRENGSAVADLTSVLVVRNPEVSDT